MSDTEVKLHPAIRPYMHSIIGQAFPPPPHESQGTARERYLRARLIEDLLPALGVKGLASRRDMTDETVLRVIEALEAMIAGTVRLVDGQLVTDDGELFSPAPGDALPEVLADTSGSGPDDTSDRPANDDPHTCHATGCDTRVPPRLLMCSTHWAMVPRHIQREVWRAYREGQEITKTPSAEYVRVARKAIRAVASAEGRR